MNLVKISITVVLTFLLLIHPAQAVIYGRIVNPEEFEARSTIMVVHSSFFKNGTGHRHFGFRCAHYNSGSLRGAPQRQFPSFYQ